MLIYTATANENENVENHHRNPQNDLLVISLLFITPINLISHFNELFIPSVLYFRIMNMFNVYVTL